MSEAKTGITNHPAKSCPQRAIDGTVCWLKAAGYSSLARRRWTKHCRSGPPAGRLCIRHGLVGRPNPGPAEGARAPPHQLTVSCRERSRPAAARSVLLMILLGLVWEMDLNIPTQQASGCVSLAVAGACYGHAYPFLGNTLTSKTSPLAVCT